MKTLITILLISIVFLCFVKILEIGLRRHEKVECLEWQKQGQTYEGWYSTNWQKEQCRQFGIEL